MRLCVSECDRAAAQRFGAAVRLSSDAAVAAVLSTGAVTVFAIDAADAGAQVLITGEHLAHASGATGGVIGADADVYVAVTSPSGVTVFSGPRAPGGVASVAYAVLNTSAFAAEGFNASALTGEVATHGHVVAVVADGRFANHSAGRAVYVFALRGAAGGALLQRRAGPLLSLDVSFGASIDLSEDGVVVVGAPGAAGGGAVHVFDANSTAPTLLASLRVPGAVAFGGAVWAAAGAIIAGDAGAKGGRGSASVFVRTGGSGAYTGVCDTAGAAAGAAYGSAVAIAGAEEEHRGGPGGMYAACECEYGFPEWALPIRRTVMRILCLTWPLAYAFISRIDPPPFEVCVSRMAHVAGAAGTVATRGCTSRSWVPPA